MACKALTLPVHSFESANRSKTVIDAKVDLQLLFLCECEILSKDLASVTDNAGCYVILYLHVLSTGQENVFSKCYRVLKLERNIFQDEIVRNNCVLPKRYFVSKCLRDNVPTELTVRIGKKLKFSASFMKSYLDFNTYFLNLYKNSNYNPHKMFLTAHRYFKFGIGVSLYVVGSIYDKYYDLVETTNPKENFHLLNYLVRRYMKYSLKEMDSAVNNFEKLIRLFRSKSMETYCKLNEISKVYSHDETAGVVCSYAMTKSFRDMSPVDFVDPSKSDRYRSMISNFESLIRYYNEEKFEKIDQEVFEHTRVQDRSPQEITRYLMKRSTDDLFGLDIKKVELKQLVSKAIVKFYGVLPPPHVELHPMSLLCEMMAGAFDEQNRFAATEIMKLKPFKPVLTKWKDKEYRVVTLNGLNIDKPIPRSVIEAIRRHLRNPSLNSYLQYCWELTDHVTRSDYFFHETINPFLPIFTINADIDIFDKRFVKLYYECDDQWAIKEKLFIELKQLVLYVCGKAMKLPVSEDNTIFFMFESIRDDLGQIESSKFKLGIRLIVKFSTVCFANRSVVHSFLKILNVYRYRFDNLRQIQDENIFDGAVYGQASHEIRLPLNLKPDGSKALMPVFFKCHSETFSSALLMTSALVHQTNITGECLAVRYVYDLTLPTEDIMSRLETEHVYKKMYLAKRDNKFTNQTEKEETWKNFKFSEDQKRQLIEAIDRYSMGRLRRSSNKTIWKIFMNKPLTFQGQNKFAWCSGLKFCAITAHVKAMGNPCDYYVRLYSRSKDSKTECRIFCHCYSSRCQEQTRNHCIWKLIF